MGPLGTPGELLGTASSQKTTKTCPKSADIPLSAFLVFPQLDDAIVKCYISTSHGTLDHPFGTVGDPGGALGGPFVSENDQSMP